VNCYYGSLLKRPEVYLVAKLAGGGGGGGGPRPPPPPTTI